MLESWHGTAAVWKRGMRRGLLNILRERDWLTTFGALIGVCLLLQFSILSLLGMTGVHSMLRSRAALHLEILDSATNQEVQTFLSTVQQLPEVESMHYITKEQAFAQMQQRDPELVAFIEEFGMENPFPETVSVTLHTLDDYEQFTQFLQQERWHDIVDPAFLSERTTQEEEIQELLQLTNSASVVTAFLILLTIGTIVFIAVELVRERVLRRAGEVLVEHLSGAFGWTIRIPFATETTLLLIVAMLGSVLLVAALLLGVHMTGSGTGEAIRMLQQNIQDVITTHAWWIIAAELLAIPLLGWMGAWLGTLHKINPRSLLIHRHT